MTVYDKYFETLPSDHKHNINKWFDKTSHEEQQAAYTEMSEHYDKDFAHARSSDTCVDVMLKYLPKSGPLRILDAGCGTGFAGEHVRRAYGDREIRLLGVDYTPAMMEVADRKKIYDTLFQGDFSAPFDFPPHDAADVDGLVASGIFFGDHAEPEYVVNMAAHMKSGAIAVFSVRDTFYERKQDRMDQAIRDARLEVVSRERLDYWNDGTVTGNYLVLRKM